MSLPHWTSTLYNFKNREWVEEICWTCQSFDPQIWILQKKRLDSNEQLCWDLLPTNCKCSRLQAKHRVSLKSLTFHWAWWSAKSDILNQLYKFVIVLSMLILIPLKLHFATLETPILQICSGDSG
jgi:hypothetical protein